MKVERDGFLKVDTSILQVPELESDRRVALIRRGNQFFNEGDVEMARRVFTTASYNPGLERVADFYFSEGAYWEAFRIYTQASIPEKRDLVIQQMARTIRHLLRQSESPRPGGAD